MVERFLDALARVTLAAIVLLIIVIRIGYCCIIHTDEMFGKHPQRGIN